MPNAFTKHAAASAPVSASIAPLKRKHQPHQAVGRAEALQQRLVGEPFAHKPVERRQRRNGHRADQEARRPSCGIRLISPPISSMLRVCVACRTAPAPRNSSALKMAWLMV